MTLHLTGLRFRHGVPRDTQAVHRTILTALDTDNPGRVLWANPTRGLLIVQAAVPVRAAGIGGVVESRSRPVTTHWPAGTPVRLSLIAHPARALPSTPPHRGKRVPLPIDQHETWLRRKLDAALALTEVAVQPLGVRRGRRHEHTVAHLMSAFHATGVVTDTDALAGLIERGVGPGKAYGAGLLLVVAA